MKRTVKIILFALIISCATALILTASADAADKGLEYTIQKGDTLWTISSGKLKDPFLWPKLWEANPKVHNPHLIYPDGVIFIPDELLKDSLKRDSQIGSLPTEGRKRLVPARQISPKLLPVMSKKPLVTREVLLDSGIFAQTFSPAGTIGTAESYKTAFGNGDYVYVSAEVKPVPDMKYYIVRRSDPIPHPQDDSKIIGYLLRIKGILKITGQENGKTKALIAEAYKEIMHGDQLIPYYDVNLPYEPTIARRPAIGGIVVHIIDNRLPSGAKDIVYIDKGATDGLQIGDIFNVTSATLPNPLIGRLQVFSTSDTVSAAIVINSKIDINRGDMYGN